MGGDRQPGYKGSLTVEVWKQAQQTKEAIGWDFAEAGKELDLEVQRDMDLSWTNFEGCSFYDSKLRGSIFDHANLKDTNFSEAELENCSFVGADLQGATFRNANLSNARFVDCMISAGFIGANLRGVVFENCDLGLSSFYTASLFPGQIRNCRIGGCTKPNGKRVGIFEAFKKTFF